MKTQKRVIQDLSHISGLSNISRNHRQKNWLMSSYNIISRIVNFLGSAGDFIAALPNTAVVGVFASFASAMIVYAARQFWERKKLRRALLTEVEQMEGLEECANQMNRIDPPPRRELQPDDVPAGGTIPTVIYESNAGNIGLLKGTLGKDELESVVSFYSKVLRYKSIINDIRADGKTSHADQEDLYDSIDEIASQRAQIMESSEFPEDK